MCRLLLWFYDIMDKSLFRALSCLLSLALVICLFTDPGRFTAKTGPLPVWYGLMLIWAVCAGVIHGVGFRPDNAYWRIIFSPLPAILMMLMAVVLFFCS